MRIDDKKEVGAVIDALKVYQSKGSLQANQSELSAMLEDESHRGVVIILGSYIEDALLDLICANLPKGEAHRRLLTKGGPLRSVEHRIALARALDLITEREAAALNIFREMRNACAHSRLNISFSTPELREALRLMLDGEAGEWLESADPDDVVAAYILCGSYMLKLLAGAGHEAVKRDLDQIIEELIAEGKKDAIQVEARLLESLLKTQQDK